MNYPHKSIRDLEIEIEWEAKCMTMTRRKRFRLQFNTFNHGVDHSDAIERLKKIEQCHREEHDSYLDEFNDRVNTWSHDKHRYPTNHNMWKIPDTPEYRLQ